MPNSLCFTSLFVMFFIHIIYIFLGASDSDEAYCRGYPHYPELTRFILGGIGAAYVRPSGLEMLGSPDYQVWLA